MNNLLLLVRVEKKETGLGCGGGRGESEKFPAPSEDYLHILTSNLQARMYNSISKEGVTIAEKHCGRNKNDLKSVLLAMRIPPTTFTALK